MTADRIYDDKKKGTFQRTRQVVRQKRTHDAKPEDQPPAPAQREVTVEIPRDLPVLPLRDVAVFNYMIVPLFIGREKSVLAVEAAVTDGQFLLLCTQRDETIESPEAKDLYEIGSVVQVLRLLKMPDGRAKVLVQGITRARTLFFYENGNYLCARVEALPEKVVQAPAVEQEALLRTAREQCEKILGLRGISTAEIMGVLGSVDEPGRLADLIAANLRLKVGDAQEILACLDPVTRLRLVIKHLNRESEVASMQVRIQSFAREGMDKAQKDYYLREQLKAIRRELGENHDNEEEIEELSQRIDKAGMPPHVRREAEKQIKRLAGMHNDSAEATVIRTYLDWLADLPWKKLSRDRLNIERAKAILEEDHHGLTKVKDRILEYLSVRKLNPDSKGSILCFVGPPGVGKTSLGKSIARAMGRKFQRLSLGGMHDEAEIRGHRRTYIGAMPGRIIQAVKQAGTRNPVIVLDEVDKIGSDFRGDPSAALLEALDPEQNNTFSDHYLNVPFDLSKVLFICTANQLDPIPAALRDRFEVISLPGYTMQEKLVIAKRYLLPRQRRENGLEVEDLSMPDTTLERVIREYTREAGLRNVEREIGAVCRKCARRKAEGEQPPFRITTAQLVKLLGAPRYLEDTRERSLNPGVALGLAWTSAGGEVLHVEATKMKGKGSLNLTGQLGDVMKESAQAALSYIRNRSETLGIAADFLENTDIHVHVPAGATPKDGPSAGVTMATALVSALTGRTVRGDLCMTGEITLRGRVMPVGGIKEKILAGVAFGLTDAIIPRQNSKDLEDIPQYLRRQINIHLVERMEDVLALAFCRE
jgi:ATP-dependent Lon protease